MTDKPENRRYHDMGGLPAGPIENEDHEPDLWEKRVDAMMVCLGTSAPDGKRLITVDEIRRVIEDLPPDAYDTMSYYERWVHSIATILAERGVYTPEELDAKLAEVKARSKQQAGEGAAQ
ncbi:MAG: nitrile hydratase subunit beta [Alphaproteobacteria bacterium]|nr:nitrile hydratase subunit beta [Alphaproteobacteria bacterium]